MYGEEQRKGWGTRTQDQPSNKEFERPGRVWKMRQSLSPRATSVPLRFLVRSRDNEGGVPKKMGPRLTNFTQLDLERFSFLVFLDEAGV